MHSLRVLKLYVRLCLCILVLVNTCQFPQSPAESIVLLSPSFLSFSLSRVLLPCFHSAFPDDTLAMDSLACLCIPLPQYTLNMVNQQTPSASGGLCSECLSAYWRFSFSIEHMLASSTAWLCLGYSGPHLTDTAFSEQVCRSQSTRFTVVWS